MRIIDKIEIIQKKIDYLQSKQDDLQKYIQKLQSELDTLRNTVGNEKPQIASSEKKVDHIFKTATLIEEKEITEPIKVIESEVKVNKFDSLTKGINKDNFENFIGKNIMNKIGILILIFGVLAGAKFAIDEGLISPLTRIIIGYIISLGLLAFSIKLKEKYENYSAVLLSGSLAILYLLTFISYSFYGFISQPISFLLMLVFTTFGILSSLAYNKKVIAIIGLVGSYAIPFLLSNNSGNILFLFSYITIVNTGILVLSFKKDWKILYYLAFAFTWLIYSAWYFEKYSTEEYFTLAFTFAIIFYLIFYVSFIAYKLMNKEKFKNLDVILIMLNSFFFFSLGYLLLDDHKTWNEYIGLFTVFNALIHYIVSKIIFNQKNSDIKLFYLASIMVLVFITLAIPIQLNGNWTTLLWLFEATLLFWYGRSKSIIVFEKVSYVLMILAFGSLLQDRYFNYQLMSFGENYKPFFNNTFLISITFAISFGFITKMYFDKKYAISTLIQQDENFIFQISNILFTYMKFIIPSILIYVWYISFASEIVQIYDIAFSNSMIVINETSIYNHNITSFKEISLIFYSIIFMLIFSFLNLKLFKHKKLALVNGFINFFLTLVALTAGLVICSDLREAYLNGSEYFNMGMIYLSIRYLNIIFIGLLLYSIHKIILKYFNKKKWKQFFWLGLHVVIVWILSSEMLHWMNYFDNKNAYKLSLTLLWASYSLFAIVLGIWKRHKFLRLGAIALLAITLVKLFFYDIANLSQIQIIIVLVSVGILILIMSFLYNKYTKEIEE